MFSQATTQESQSQDMAYGHKKRKASSSSGSYKKRKTSSTIPRSLPLVRDNRCTVPLTVTKDAPLTADIDALFAFSNRAIVFEGSGIGGTSVVIPGADELATCFDLVRLAKVEVTILPAATDLALNDQTLSSGTTNIPWVYEAFDPIGDRASGGTTLDDVQQLATCRTHLLNKPIKRTIYPRLEGSNGIVDVGVNRKNLFQQSGNIGSTQRWRGWRVRIENESVNWTYGQVRFTFKCFFEVMCSK